MCGATSIGEFTSGHANNLNTPRLVADASQNTVWKWDQQEPFGNDAPNGDPANTGTIFELPLRLPGQVSDRETGLYYNYFRNYDPVVGGYKESDPIGLRGGLNTYLYTSARPLVLGDPSGLLSPFWHNQISGAAATEAGFGPATASALANAVENVDKQPSRLESQDPRNAHWHCMRSEDMNRRQGQVYVEAYIETELEKCTLKGLARAIHAVQDCAAGGHQGVQIWSWGIPSWSHINSDINPSFDEIAAAYDSTRKLLKRYLSRCGCQP